MSDLFNLYEDNFNAVINRLQKVVDTINNLSKGNLINPEKTESAITDANNCFKEAEKLV
jgi:hypothetical protein